jgi:ribonuclease-3
MAGTGREQLEDLLGHKFQSPERLERALTHSSWPSEKSAVPEEVPAKNSSKISSDAVVSKHPVVSKYIGETEKNLTAPIGRRVENGGGKNSGDDNEKLEFLGDAVLTMIVSEALLQGFPEWREGQLSKARASLVNAGALAEAARRMGLGAHLRLGRGEEKTGGREKSAILADAYEAVIAAVYLDGGLAAARTAIERTLLKEAFQQDAIAGGLLGGPDDKSKLQEFLQARGWPTAKYRVMKESGPDHRKVFKVEASIEGHGSASGTGFTKKEAEQTAARKVTAKLLESVELPARKAKKTNA